MIPEYQQLLASLLKRAIFPGTLFAVGTWILLGAGNIAQMLLGLFLFLVAAILISGPLARLLAEPTGNLFWPRKYYDKPQPMYGIPQARRAKGQLEEALAEYEKIAAAHPDEVRPYLEMIDVAIHDLRDADRANAIFQSGLARLKNADDKDRLAQAYAETRTRLDVRPPHPPIAVPPPHPGP